MMIMSCASCAMRAGRHVTVSVERINPSNHQAPLCFRIASSRQLDGWEQTGLGIRSTPKTLAHAYLQQLGAVA